MKKIVFILLVFVLFAGLTPAQDYSIKSDLSNRYKNQFVSTVLSQIEKGIAEGNINIISKFLSSETYLSLLNGVSGYYSANQAYYVLEDFFKEYRVISFKFDNFKVNKLTPYATGTYYYEKKGKRSDAKVYMSLKLTGKSWKITQISIN